MKILPCLLAASLLLMLAGCQTCPQAGTYSGFQGKLGTATLRVKCDGTLTEQYLLIKKGTWIALTDDSIKVTFEIINIANDKTVIERQVWYYKLDRRNRTYNGLDNSTTQPTEMKQ